MKNKEELTTTEWAYGVFQKCVPEQYMTSIPVLVGKYSDSHPSDETIQKICDLSNKWNQYMSQTFGDISKKEKQLDYIKKHWND